MPTFIIPPERSRIIDSKGFSLLEILMALVLISFAATLVVGIRFDPSDRRELEETMDKLERSIRFGLDEAILRNRIIRIHFLLDEFPQQFSLEYAPDEEFVLSKKVLEIDDSEDLNDKEREERQQILEEMNKQFQPIDEFQEENESLPERVRIVGLGTTTLERFVLGPEASLFIYPSGEKDGALVVLATEEEMGTLSIEEFTLNFQRELLKNPEEIDEEDDSDEEGEEGDIIPTPEQEKKAMELFEEWIDT